ncbi:MAG: DUF2807 domain-containing protein, partial [Chitinophagaceae bacterium]|nr:DUF2807 domain-containing protein [Chitinophagaceae bacterium]
VIETKSGYNIDASQELKVHVTAPAFKEIEASGACNIISEAKINNAGPIALRVSGAGEIKMDLSAPRVDADLSGAGNVSINGETKEFNLGLSGAGEAKCYNLKSETTRVDISGAGTAEVFASVALTGSISGAGTINYKGGGSSNVSTSGAASVNKAD